MKNKKQLSREEKAEPEPSYFEVQAYWGVTKHFGGLKATRELVELCHIDKNKYILDIGCGVGAAACYITKKYGCKVVGVDISEKMIERAKEKAKRKGVEDRVEFRVADAQNLPFEEATFDVAIGESVLAFVEGKQRAVSEYARVVKPGGYIGLNESIWMKTLPPTELVEYISRLTGVKEFLTSDGWGKLLEVSGLKDIVIRTYKLNALSHIEEIKLCGLSDILRAWPRFLTLCITSSGFRKYIKEAWPGWTVSKNFLKYLGYGIYVGRK